MRLIMTVLISLAISGCATNTIKDRCLTDKFISFSKNDTKQTKAEIIAHNLELERYCDRKRTDFFISSGLSYSHVTRVNNKHGNKQWVI